MLQLPYTEDNNSFYQDENGSLIEVEDYKKIPDKYQSSLSYQSRIMDAVYFFQVLGMTGYCIQQKSEEMTDIYEDYDFYLEVLKVGFKRYKQRFDILYRGYRKERNDNDYQIIYTSPDINVARFYGDNIKEYRNVEGLLTYGTGKSVVTEDYQQIDHEVLIVKV